MKKRGIGKGKWNGVGGKVEDGETPEVAAVREVEEEIGVKLRSIDKVGELDFIFGGTPFMYGYVFKASSFEGSLIETEEARPRWFSLDEIPYDGMWKDDIHWMPLMFEGKKFFGRFFFDKEGENILKHELKEL